VCTFGKLSSEALQTLLVEYETLFWSNRVRRLGDFAFTICVGSDNREGVLDAVL